MLESMQELKAVDAVANPAPGLPRDSTGLVRKLLLCAVLLAGLSAGAGFLNSNVWGLGSITILWPTTGCLIGVLLCAPRQHWLAYLAVGYACDMLENMLFAPAQPTWLNFYLSGCNVIEVSLAAWLLYPTFAQGQNMSRSRQLVRLLGFGAIVAPGVASLAAGFGLSRFDGESLLQSFAHWFTADGLGDSILIPLYLGLQRKPWFSSRPWPEIVALFAVLCAVSGVVFWQTALPLLFCILPFLLLIEIRLGLSGSAIGLLAVVAIGGYGTALGHGPVALSHFASVASHTLALQAFIFVCLLFLYVTDVVIAEKTSLERDLRSSERLFRLLTENSSDLIILYDMTTEKRLYVSPSVKQVLGWDQKEMREIDRKMFVHPDDLSYVNRMFRECRESKSLRVADFRARKKDLSYLWMQFHLVANLDPATGIAESIVSVTRDISARKAEEEELRKTLGAVQNLANIDALTGMDNRRSFDNYLVEAWSHAAQSADTISLLMIDVDFFKRYNDSVGHVAGDQGLKDVARSIASCVLLPGGMVARYGGEEFAVIAPATDAEDARLLAEQICSSVALKQIPHPGIPAGHVTVSVGCATLAATPDLSAVHLVRCADLALYQAKSDGRNCVREFRTR